MKRLHIHLKVNDLAESIAFYSALFATEATVTKDDYAKWMLDDPRVNFAISTTGSAVGVEHLGIQTESREELGEVYTNLENAKGQIFREGETVCCYHQSEKSWITDPQGVEWEAFYTHGEATIYGHGRDGKPTDDTPSGCCTPTNCC